MPIENKVDNLANPTKVDNSIEYINENGLPPLNGCVVETFQDVESNSLRKRGRKPNLFYSEDDLLEITNVGGDEGILFLSLEESPKSYPKKKVSDKKASLPISVAMHYKQKKVDLATSDIPIKVLASKSSSDIQPVEESNLDTLKDNTKIIIEKKKRGRKPKKKRLIANSQSKNESQSPGIQNPSIVDDNTHDDSLSKESLEKERSSNGVLESDAGSLP